MNIDKICIMLIISIVAFSGIISSGIETSSGAETWVAENPALTSFGISDLWASIKVTVKNNEDHIQYFKISQVYQGSLTEESKITWRVVNAPGAVRMVKTIASDGDLGWPINPGQTRTVSFTLAATGRMGDIKSYIINVDSTNKTYWPLINEPGLIGSWFTPNELEILDPSLDLKKWTGHFSFHVSNIDSAKVYGIVRAPIAPVNSKLTSSSPKAFIDDETVVSSNIAAWNIILNPGQSQVYQYTYVWPKTSTSSSVAKATSASITTGSSGSSDDPTVPSKTTGVPYGLFVVGTLVTAAGVAYARFMR